MAKTKKTKNIKKSFADKVIGLPFLITIIVAVFLFGAYRFARQLLDKPNFVKIENTVKEFANAANLANISPEAQEIKNYCENESMKFTKGRLYCGTSAARDYPVKNLEQAKPLITNLEKVIRNDKHFKIINESSTEERPDYYSKYITLELLGDERERDCSLAMKFKAPTNNIEHSSVEVGRAKDGFFSWYLRCERFSYWEYYQKQE